MFYQNAIVNSTASGLHNVYSNINPWESNIPLGDNRASFQDYTYHLIDFDTDKIMLEKAEAIYNEFPENHPMQDKNIFNELGIPAISTSLQEKPSIPCESSTNVLMNRPESSAQRDTSIKYESPTYADECYVKCNNAGQLGIQIEIGEPHDFDLRFLNVENINTKNKSKNFRAGEMKIPTEFQPQGSKFAFLPPEAVDIKKQTKAKHQLKDSTTNLTYKRKQNAKAAKLYRLRQKQKQDELHRIIQTLRSENAKLRAELDSLLNERNESENWCVFAGDSTKKGLQYLPQSTLTF